MGYDLVIRGGMVVDGTGKAPHMADVAVLDGKIVEVGECLADAARVVDAEGCHVTPGFVDVHTHYDGQVSWDPDLAPSVFHGVTTAVMGNCGVGFAPVMPGSEATLVELMEGVEDIPGAALAEGIPWGWESFADYLDVLGAMDRTIDICAQVPHDALRLYVMGERGAAGELATPGDVAEMRRLAREALEAGAVGISTGRSDNHKTAQGAETPARFAGRDELIGLASAVVGLDHGVIQIVSDFQMGERGGVFDQEFDLVDAMAEAAGGHALSMSLIERLRNQDQWRWIAERSEALVERGMPIKLQVASRAIGVLLGLETTFQPFMGFPSYKAISHLPLAERVAAMREPDFRARILAEEHTSVAGDGSALPPLADVMLANVELVASRLFRLGASPDYEPTADMALAREADASGRDHLEVVFDALLEADGQQLLYLPLFNYGSGDLSVIAEMMSHPLAIPGLSDGGAHVGTVCDASMPTYLLSHWARDRSEGLPIEQVIKMQCADTAAHIGLDDRGVIEVGKRADLNVIDMAEIGIGRPELVADLPAGGKRLLQSATGYRSTLVGGVAVQEDGVLTGERPGEMVRLGQ